MPAHRGDNGDTDPGLVRFLHETPNARGMLRSTGTIQSYIRSVRAFCQWLVQQRYLQRTPCPQRLLPIVEPSLPRLLDQQDWERFLQACKLLEESQPWSSKRRHAIVPCSGYFLRRGCVPLKLCNVRLSDVDREQGQLKVRGKGSKARWIPLRQEELASCWSIWIMLVPRRTHQERED